MNKAAEFVYRVATTRDRRRFIWSVAGAVFWYGIVAIIIAFSPWLDRILGLTLSMPTPVRLPVAIVLLMIGITMVLWTIIRFLRTRGTPVPFNPPPSLVTNGLYNIVRNPMHLGWTLIIIGAAILEQSFLLLVVFTPVFILIHVLYIKIIEEKELEKKFGQAYLDYKKRVPMWLPKLPPF
jgi:protein-S-isoprenylcysteine O-methyltransferase Ste14